LGLLWSQQRKMWRRACGRPICWLSFWSSWRSAAGIMWLPSPVGLVFAIGELGWAVGRSAPADNARPDLWEAGESELPGPPYMRSATVVRGPGRPGHPPLRGRLLGFWT